MKSKVKSPSESARWIDLSKKLKAGEEVQDLEFDQIYPHSVRALSGDHWTPVQVAARASRFLVSSSNTQVLDVGSGCGKFCTIAALLSGARVVGIEQRPHLLSAARNAARKLRAHNAKFLFGNMTELDWS